MIELEMGFLDNDNFRGSVYLARLFRGTRDVSARNPREKGSTYTSSDR